jgi:hypothetical protein
MRKSLRHLGINDSNFRVLKLLPLVYVAWNSGRLSPEREERLVDLAHNHFAIGEAGERILRGWLQQRPGISYFKEGLHDLLLLAHAPDELEFDMDELPSLLAFAEAIARTTAEAMDAPTSVTPEEELALADMARELDVDEGESWAALIRELRDTPRTTERSQSSEPAPEPLRVPMLSTLEPQPVFVPTLSTPAPEPLRFPTLSTPAPEPVPVPMLSTPAPEPVRVPELTEQRSGGFTEDTFPSCSKGDGRGLSPCQPPMHGCARRPARKHLQEDD